ncbi:MAG: flagella basal body P-ring formation protein FlgA [Anaerolineales bacterium]|nr:flagella basal body P-ring formation protein FlgA [Anaerolineales bacterium]
MSRRTIGIIIVIVGVIAIGIGVLGIRQVLKSSTLPQAAPTQLPPLTEKVVTASQDVEIGHVIGEEDIIQKSMPVEIIPRNAIKEPENVVGKIAKTALVSGEIIQTHHVANPDVISHDLGFVIDQDLVLIAIPATDLMSSLNVLQRGDLIDILVTIENEVEPTAPEGEGEQPILPPGEEPQKLTRAFTFDALQAQDLTAVIVDVTYETENTATVPQKALENLEEGGATPSEQLVKVTKKKVLAYLLALRPQDALVLKHLIDTGGKFDIVLRPPDATQLYDLQAVISEYIIDRFQLEVPTK